MPGREYCESCNRKVVSGVILVGGDAYRTTGEVQLRLCKDCLATAGKILKKIGLRYTIAIP